MPTHNATNEATVVKTAQLASNLPLDNLELAKEQTLENLKDVVKANLANSKLRSSVSIAPDGAFYVTTLAVADTTLMLSSVFVERKLPGSYVLALDLAGLVSTHTDKSVDDEDRINVRFKMIEPTSLVINFALGLEGVVRAAETGYVIDIDDIHIIPGESLADLTGHILTPLGAATLMRAVADAVKVSILKAQPILATQTMLEDYNWKTLMKLIPRMVPRCFTVWGDNALALGRAADTLVTRELAIEEATAEAATPLTVVSGGRSA